MQELQSKVGEPMQKAWYPNQGWEEPTSDHQTQANRNKKQSCKCMHAYTGKRRESAKRKPTANMGKHKAVCKRTHKISKRKPCIKNAAPIANTKKEKCMKKIMRLYHTPKKGTKETNKSTSSSQKMHKQSTQTKGKGKGNSSRRNKKGKENVNPAPQSLLSWMASGNNNSRLVSNEEEANQPAKQPQPMEIDTSSVDTSNASNKNKKADPTNSNQQEQETVPRSHIITSEQRPSLSSSTSTDRTIDTNTPPPKTQETASISPLRMKTEDVVEIFGVRDMHKDGLLVNGRLFYDGKEIPKGTVIIGRGDPTVPATNIIMKIFEVDSISDLQRPVWDHRIAGTTWFNVSGDQVELTKNTWPRIEVDRKHREEATKTAADQQQQERLQRIQPPPNAVDEQKHAELQTGADQQTQKSMEEANNNDDDGQQHSIVTISSTEDDGMAQNETPSEILDKALEATLNSSKKRKRHQMDEEDENTNTTEDNILTPTPSKKRKVDIQSGQSDQPRSSNSNRSIIGPSPFVHDKKQEAGTTLTEEWMKAAMKEENVSLSIDDLRANYVHNNHTLRVTKATKSWAENIERPNNHEWKMEISNLQMALLGMAFAFKRKKERLAHCRKWYEQHIQMLYDTLVEREDQIEKLEELHDSQKVQTREKEGALRIMCQEMDKAQTSMTQMENQVKGAAAEQEKLLAALQQERTINARLQEMIKEEQAKNQAVQKDRDLFKQRLLSETKKTSQPQKSRDEWTRTKKVLDTKIAEQANQIGELKTKLMTAQQLNGSERKKWAKKLEQQQNDRVTEKKDLCKAKDNLRAKVQDLKMKLDTLAASQPGVALLNQLEDWKGEATTNRMVIKRLEQEKEELQKKVAQLNQDWDLQRLNLDDNLVKNQAKKPAKQSQKEENDEEEEAKKEEAFECPSLRLHRRAPHDKTVDDLQLSDLKQIGQKRFAIYYDTEELFGDLYKAIEEVAPGWKSISALLETTKYPWEQDEQVIINRSYAIMTNNGNRTTNIRGWIPVSTHHVANELNDIMMTRLLMYANIFEVFCIYAGGQEAAEARALQMRDMATSGKSTFLAVVVLTKSEVVIHANNEQTKVNVAKKEKFMILAGTADFAISFKATDSKVDDQYYHLCLFIGYDEDRRLNKVAAEVEQQGIRAKIKEIMQIQSPVKKKKSMGSILGLFEEAADVNEAARSREMQRSNSRRGGLRGGYGAGRRGGFRGQSQDRQYASPSPLKSDRNPKHKKINTTQQVNHEAAPGTGQRQPLQVLVDDIQYKQDATHALLHLHRNANKARLIPPKPMLDKDQTRKKERKKSAAKVNENRNRHTQDSRNRLTDWIRQSISEIEQQELIRKPGKSKKETKMRTKWMNLLCYDLPIYCEVLIAQNMMIQNKYAHKLINLRYLQRSTQPRSGEQDKNSRTQPKKRSFTADPYYNHHKHAKGKVIARRCRLYFKMGRYLKLRLSTVDKQIRQIIHQQHRKLNPFYYHAQTVETEIIQKCSVTWKQDKTHKHIDIIIPIGIYTKYKRTVTATLEQISHIYTEGAHWQIKELAEQAKNADSSQSNEPAHIAPLHECVECKPPNQKKGTEPKIHGTHRTDKSRHRRRHTGQQRVNTTQRKVIGKITNMSIDRWQTRINPYIQAAKKKYTVRWTELLIPKYQNHCDNAIALIIGTNRTKIRRLLKDINQISCMNTKQNGSIINAKQWKRVKNKHNVVKRNRATITGFKNMEELRDGESHIGCTLKQGNTAEWHKIWVTNQYKINIAFSNTKIKLDFMQKWRNHPDTNKYKIFHDNEHYHRIAHRKQTHQAIRQLYKTINDKINQSEIDITQKQEIQRILQQLTPETIRTEQNRTPIPTHLLTFMNCYQIEQKRRAYSTVAATGRDHHRWQNLRIMTRNIDGKLEDKLQDGSPLHTQILMETPDIICLQEVMITALTQAEFKRNHQIETYTLIAWSRGEYITVEGEGRPSGGMATWARTSLLPNNQITTVLNDTYKQIICIKPTGDRLYQTPTIYIQNVYIRPITGNQQTIGKIQAEIDILHRFQTEHQHAIHIIVGDQNAKHSYWADPATNKAGMHIYQKHINNGHWECLNKILAFQQVTYEHRSIIDLILVPPKQTEQWEQIQIHKDREIRRDDKKKLRHHTLIISAAKIPLKHTISAPRYNYTLDLVGADKHCVRKKIRSQARPIQNEIIERILHQIRLEIATKEEGMNLLQHIINAIHHLTILNIGGIRKTKYYAPSSLTKDQQQLKELADEYQETMITGNTMQYQRAAQIIVTKRMKQKTDKQKEMDFSSIEATFREYTKMKQQQKLQIPKQMRNKNGYLTTAASAYAEYISEVLMREPEDTKHKHIDTEITAGVVTCDRIQQTLQGLKKDKAPGITQIPVYYYWWGGEPMIQMLYDWLHQIEKHQYIPKILKVDIKSPIPKFESGDSLKVKQDPTKYRPIALQNSMYKILDGNIKIALEEHDKEHGIIHINQGGFKQEEGTVEHLYTIRNIYSYEPDTICAFLDLQKAYDTVNRQHLLYKLRAQYAVPTHVVALISTMYHETHSTIQLAHQQTKLVPTKRGLHQGALSSPILFNYFINDLIEELNKQTEIGPKINHQRINNLLFADDINLMATNPTDTQTLLNICTRWAEYWGLQFAPDKSKLVLNKQNKNTNLKLRLQFKHITQAEGNLYKYLGKWIDETGIAVQKNYKHIQQRYNAAGRHILTYCYKNRVPMKYRTTLYKTNIRSQIEYAAQVVGMTDTQQSKLEQTQQRTLRRLTGADKWTKYETLTTTTNILKVKNRLKELKLAFLNKLHHKRGPSMAGSQYANITSKLPMKKHDDNRQTFQAEIIKIMKETHTQLVTKCNQHHAPSELKQHIKHQIRQTQLQGNIQKMASQRKRNISDLIRGNAGEDEPPSVLEVHLRKYRQLQIKLENTYIPTRYEQYQSHLIPMKAIYLDNNPNWAIPTTCQRCGKWTECMQYHLWLGCTKNYAHRQRIINSIITEITEITRARPPQRGAGEILGPAAIAQLQHMTHHKQPSMFSIKETVHILMGNRLNATPDRATTDRILAVLQSHLLLIMAEVEVAQKHKTQERENHRPMLAIPNGEVELHDIEKGKIVATMVINGERQTHNIREWIERLQPESKIYYHLGLGSANTRTKKQKRKAQDYVHTVMREITGITAYVDAAVYKTEKLGGYGAVIVDQKTQTQMINFNEYVDTTDSQKAELIGIREVLLHLRKNTTKYTAKNINILCDCKPAVQKALGIQRSPRHYRQITQTIQETKMELQLQEKRIRIIWMPGHIDDKWNDVVDSLAKRGARQRPGQQFNHYTKHMEMDRYQALARSIIARHHSPPDKSDEWDTESVVTSSSDTETTTSEHDDEHEEAEQQHEPFSRYLLFPPATPPPVIYPVPPKRSRKPAKAAQPQTGHPLHIIPYLNSCPSSQGVQLAQQRHKRDYTE